MSLNKNNDVFSVLVGKAGQDVIRSGDPISALALGQIGVFSWESNLSVDGAAIPEDVRKFYIAVGIDTDGDGVVDDYAKSDIIERGRVTAYTARCYNPPRPWIFDLIGFTAECDTDYNVVMRIDNGALRQLSTDALKKSYFVHTGCCDGCEECPSGNCVELAGLIVDKVNNDEQGLFTAAAIAPNTGTIEVTHVPDGGDGDVTFTLDGVDVVVALLAADTIDQAGVKIAAAFDALAGWSATYDAATDTITLVKTSVGDDTTLTFADTDSTDLTVTIVEPVPVVLADLDDFVADYGADACPGVRFTSVLPSIRTFCGINANYVKFREFEVTPTFGDSFACNGTWITKQIMTHEEGLGYDVAWEEYESGGWFSNPGSPYRQSGLHGLPKEISYNAISSSKYVCLVISSKKYAVAGFSRDYDNPITTRVYIPIGEDAIASLVAITDAILDGSFGPLSDDVALCPGDGTTIHNTEDQNYNSDGIG